MKGKRLNAGLLRSLPPGMHSDGGGLNLRVKPNGAMSWIQRVTINGTRHNVGLGSFPAISLSEARAAASANTATIQRGGNPLQDKHKEQDTAKPGKKAKTDIPTFEQAAREFHALRRPSWKSEQHAGEWIRSLEQHVFPTLGNIPVDSIESADVMTTVTPVWTAKPETASRLRNRIESVIDYAIANGKRKDANPAGKFLLKALPKRNHLDKKHHAALPFAELPQVLTTIRETGREITALAVEYIILTGCRSNEMRYAEWSEIDIESALWTIPAHKMKGGREHRIPLSPQALEVLSRARELTGGDGLIFPSTRDASKPMTAAAPIRVLHRAGIDATIHGFRSSFRDWLAECTSATWNVAETCLAHTVGGHVAQAYARTDYLELRRPLMQQWADYLAG